MFEIIDNFHFIGEIGDVIEDEDEFYYSVSCIFDEYKELGARLWTIEEAIKEGKIKRI